MGGDVQGKRGRALPPHSRRMAMPACQLPWQSSLIPLPCNAPQNVLSVMALVRAFTPSMVVRNRGHLLFMSRWVDACGDPTMRVGIPIFHVLMPFGSVGFFAMHVCASLSAPLGTVPRCSPCRCCHHPAALHACQLCPPARTSGAASLGGRLTAAAAVTARPSTHWKRLPPLVSM